MHTSFQTLKEFNEYVPLCLICGKDMGISVDSVLGPIPGMHKRWASGREAVHLKMIAKDELLQSKHKSHKLHINPNNNLIVEGLDLAARFNEGVTYVKKMCATCHFKIHATCSSLKIKKEKKFPLLTLFREELHFTMRGGKDLRITKIYGNPSDKGEPILANIQLNWKYLPPLPIDFSKFTSFEQLVKRINTMIIFH